LPDDALKPAEPRSTILVYRDRIVPRSEAHFLRRLYLGFDRLAPVWVGCRRDEGAGDLGVEPLILGRAGPLGTVDRFRFKQWGVLPPEPDLLALRPRLVHAQFGRGGALALPLARALGIPLVVTFHGGDATKDKHYQRRWPPRIYQRRLDALKHEAALFIAVSEYIAGRLRDRGFPPDKIRVLRYGVEVDPGDVAPAGAVPPYFLFVGRFVEKKGISHLLDAMLGLAAAGIMVDLRLVGDGPLAASLRETAAALPQVQFLGWQPQDQVRRWMRGALAVCVPSVEAAAGDAEGLPNVVLEAMAAGVPVVGSRSAGIGEAVVDGATGLLVPPADPAALAAALRRLVADPALALAMGAAAKRRAAEEFDARTQSRRLEALLLEVIRAHEAPRS
jgi:glycosyltransferase involved in cell wall biosynthesis